MYVRIDVPQQFCFLHFFQITNSGYPVIISAGWYLDSLKSGGDWWKLYTVDVHDFHGSDRQRRLVLGGTACMWGEVVDTSNIMPRIWPRASTIAERLWSTSSVVNIRDAQRRLEEHYCRMRKRGIEAQPPNGPGYCV